MGDSERVKLSVCNVYVCLICPSADAPGAARGRPTIIKTAPVDNDIGRVGVTNCFDGFYVGYGLRVVLQHYAIHER